MTTWAVETSELTKDYPVGFWRRRSKRALERLTLRVERGEIFGLLGPNGAGKTTTLSILLHLIFPTSGTARVLGRDVADAAVHTRIGYLPENPYFYDHLTAREFLTYAAELFGLPRAPRRRRVGELLEQVGLEESLGLPIRKFSKGMVQRLGIAQALVNDPELVFLDEPMSGLDPLGRRQIRDLILDLRRQGKTVFFSTHILSDAEALCDRVAILNRGRCEGAGELGRILGLETAANELVLQKPSGQVLEALRPFARGFVRTGERVRVEVPANVPPQLVLRVALDAGAAVVSLNPVKRSLEDFFLAQIATSNNRSESHPGAGSDNSSPLPARGLDEAANPAVPVPAQREEPGRDQVPSFGTLSRIAAVARHAFKESVRDKVLYSLVAFAVLLTGAAIVFSTISIGINEILLVNLGLSAISVFGLLIAVFIGISLVWKEIERRTVRSILSKPVRRFEFILGKYFGLLLTLVVNTAVMAAGFYLAMLWQKRGLDAADLASLETIYLILLQLALVVAVALLFSTLSTPVLSAVFTFSLFVIGNFLEDLRALGERSSSAAARGLLGALAYALPDFAGFNWISRAAHKVPVPSYILSGDSLYALLYIAVLLAASVLIFEERQFR